MFKEEFIKAITANGDSIEGIAKRVGKSKQWLYKRISRPSMIPINQLILLSDCSKVEVEQLIKWAKRTKDKVSKKVK